MAALARITDSGQTSVLECFHLEVCRSHPRLYRAEGVLGQSGDVRASCPGSDRAVLARSQGRLRAPTVRSAALCLSYTGPSLRSLAGGGPAAPQCLAVLFIGVAIGQLLTGRATVDVVRGNINEVLLAEPSFGIDAEVIGFGK